MLFQIKLIGLQQYWPYVTDLEIKDCGEVKVL
jgi:hypothetical protein